MLKKETVSATCVECHKETIQKKHVHTPAGTSCTECHKPHSAPLARLLTKEPQALCLSCHESVAKRAQGSKHPHEPAGKNCLECHSAHSSDEPMVLKMPALDLCISCHQEVGGKASAAAHKHGAVMDRRACLNCHNPHGTEHAKLLADDPVKSCLECHRTPIKVSKERTVAGVPELSNPGMHRHAPIVEGNCAACHQVHGGDHAKLLNLNYTTSFYQPYSDDAYALCFKCHDRSLAASQVASKETGFRDADRNLHFIHVTKGEKGRSCRACHSVHASPNEKLIAPTVNFGEWKLPLNFTKTPDGASCAPGCHKPRSYDRRPIAERSADPASAPASSGPTSASPGEASPR
jgi:predicted CXXCH cytochrome family protein